ncbi:MAG: molybdenum cofactor guanylyltransferase [Nitrospirota bacterium]
MKRAGKGSGEEVATAVILAGGANKRFPTLKGFIKIGETTILERNLALLRTLFPEVMVSANTPELYFRLGAPLVGDVLPSRGPMAGIHAALLNAKGDAVFAVACDMPFIAPALITALVERHRKATQQEPVDATVPRCKGALQPLFGIYSKEVLPVLEEHIVSDRCSLKPFLDEVRTCIIDEAAIQALDSEGRSFVNINTVEDYRAVLGPGAPERNAALPQGAREGPHRL